jgi:ATP-dependent Clp endopeptidase proteolytic subunit ClpP
MSKNFFKIAVKNVVVENNPTESVLELYFLDLLYNTVQYDWWSGMVVETNVVEEVVSQVKAANPPRIKLIIDSQGGDAAIGIALYNFLKNYSAKVEVDVIGMAGSIVSVLAMAANKGKLVMARNAFMVIHKAWGTGCGNSDDLRAAADIIDKYTDQICDIYSQRTGKSVDEIKSLIEKGDYWMTGSEAQEQGFCDSIYNDNAQFQIAARVSALDAHYKNVPQNLLDSGNEDAPTFKNYIKNEVMEIKTLVSNFISSLKTPAKAEGSTETTPVSNEVKAVADGLEKPLTDFLTTVQNEMKEEVKKEVGNQISAALTGLQEFKDLTKES